MYGRKEIVLVSTCNLTVPRCCRAMRATSMEVGGAPRGSHTVTKSAGHVVRRVMPRHTVPKSAREGGRVREGGSGAQIAVFLMPDSSCTIVVPPGPSPLASTGCRDVHCRFVRTLLTVGFLGIPTEPAGVQHDTQQVN